MLGQLIVAAFSNGTQFARGSGVQPEEAKAERRQSRARRAVSARVVHEALRSEGASELKRPWPALAWSGFAAGISMGLSMIGEGVLLAHLPDAPWRPLVSSFGYTIGFVAVTMGRQQLFTETTVTACLPVLNNGTTRMLGQVLRFWCVVLAANLAGAMLFAWVASRPSTFAPELHAAFTLLAAEALEHDASSAFVRGIFGGWIIALTVWLLPAAEATRLWIIILMTYLIAAANLTHIIAGSVEVFYGIAATEIAWTRYFAYGLPVLAGNSIGGIVFVALLNHAQVKAGAVHGRS